eukprot:s531_g2.t1
MLSHFSASQVVKFLGVVAAAVMWSVGDICKEIQDVSKLIEGKDTNDSFGQALVKGVCAKIKGLADLPPGDALQLKEAARFLPDAHLKSIVDQLEQRLTYGVGDVKQALVLKPQTLLHIYNYMTQDDWVELDNPSTSWARKQTVVALRLKKLGVASMHEQTCKSCMALLACSLTVVPEEKMMYDMLQEFKATFASTMCTTKCSNIVKYPEHPKELCQEVFQAAYGSDQPCPKVIDKFNLVAKKVVLRSTSKHIRHTPAKVEQAQSASAGSASTMNDMVNGQMMQMLGMMSRFMGMNMGNHGDGSHSQHQQLQGQSAQAALHNFKPKTQLALGDAPAPEATTKDTDSKLVLPCSTPALSATEHPDATTTTPATQKGNSSDSLETQPEEPDYEEAAFTALKNRQALAKAKAKAGPKAKAKGKAKALPKAAVMKRPSSSKASASKKAKKLDYKVPPPSEAQLKSTPRNYYDKHYHKCKQMAIKTGYSEEEACELAKNARATAVELWDNNCS